MRINFENENLLIGERNMEGNECVKHGIVEANGITMHVAEQDCAVLTWFSSDLVHVTSPDGQPSRTPLPCHLSDAEAPQLHSFLLYCAISSR